MTLPGLMNNEPEIKFFLRYFMIYFDHIFILMSFLHLIKIPNKRNGVYHRFNIVLNGCHSQCELDDDEFDFYVERKCNRKICTLHLHNVQLTPNRIYIPHRSRYSTKKHCDVEDVTLILYSD